MPRGLYESVAHGGPLDGIKVGSGLGWNGRIVKRRTDGHNYYHQGYYAWQPIAQRWEWHAEVIKPEGVPQRRPVSRGEYRSDKQLT